MTDISDIAAEFDRLSPSQVDTTLAGNGQQQAGHTGHYHADGSWPSVGWYCDGGNAGNPVIEIHPDDLDAALTILQAMPDGAADANGGAIDTVLAGLKTAGIRHDWLF